MGRVYRARHEAWGFELAMKVPLGDPGLARRGSILREAEAWASLGLHPHVVTCHYAIVVEGVPWIFAELVEGGSLADWIADRRLYAGPDALARTLDVAIQIALGLDHAVAFLESPHPGAALDDSPRRLVARDHSRLISFRPLA
mgnify:CR=1 FL=1